MNEFPKDPIHGQEYVDGDDIVWVYNEPTNSWTVIAPLLDIPIARSGNKCAEEAV